MLGYHKRPWLPWRVLESPMEKRYLKKVSPGHLVSKQHLQADSCEPCLGAQLCCRELAEDGMLIHRMLPSGKCLSAYFKPGTMGEHTHPWSVILVPRVPQGWLSLAQEGWWGLGGAQLGSSGGYLGKLKKWGATKVQACGKEDEQEVAWTFPAHWDRRHPVNKVLAV